MNKMRNSLMMTLLISQIVLFFYGCQESLEDNFINKDELDQVYELVKKGSFNNMTTMNMSIFKLFSEGIISQETALANSDNRNELEQMMRGIYYGTGANKSSSSS